MASNPNPARITAETWRLWEEISQVIPGVEQLGGIYANKPGYHNTRTANSSNDYSVQYAADKRGPSDKAAAVDVTFPEAHGGDYTRIKKYSTRLANAIVRQDPRVGGSGTPFMREVIGNFGGKAKAIDAYTETFDARDDSHLWHIHISLTREYVDEWKALSGIVAVVEGEDEYQGDDMIGLKKGDDSEGVEALQAILRYTGDYEGSVDDVYGSKTAAAVLACRKRMGSTEESGDKIDGFAYAQIHKALAIKMAQEHGKPGPPGPAGEDGKTPTKIAITGEVTAVE